MLSADSPEAIVSSICMSRDRNRELVSSWLTGGASCNAPFAAAETDEELPLAAPRPGRLGLGAKFLPHSCVVGVDSRFEKIHRKLTAKSRLQREEDAVQRDREATDRENDGESDSDSDAHKGSKCNSTSLLRQRESATHQKTPKRHTTFESFQQQILKEAETVRDALEAKKRKRQQKNQRKKANKRNKKVSMTQHQTQHEQSTQ